MLLQAFSSHNSIESTNIRRNVNTLTRNGLTLVLLFILLTAGMMLMTPQDAHAQSISVSFTEPTGTQTTKTFLVSVTSSHVSSGGPGNKGEFTVEDVTLTTVQGSQGSTVVAIHGTGKNFNVEIRPPGNATGNITLTIKANSIGSQDPNHGYIEGPSSAVTSNSISFDTTNLLMVDFTEPEDTQTGSTFTVPIDFSHTVTGFAASDITATTTRTSGTGDATVSLSGSGSSYTATVTPPSNAVGNVTLTIAKDAVTF